MNFNGLSIEQAPPISAPLRFYLTAPLFAIIAGFLIFFSDRATLISRYSIDSILITHALTIGFISFIMLGSLTQMLPVLAGVVIEKVNIMTKVAYTFLVLGMMLMLLGLHLDNSSLTIFAIIGLGSGFLIMISVIGVAISKVKNFTATVKAMATSLFFAFFVVVMGMFLLYTYVDNSMSSLRPLVANIHSVWAISGFVGILIIGVSFQVLPMFYVAPKFKSFCKQKVVLLISIGLFIWLGLNLFYETYSLIAKLWIAVFFWAFATTVWVKLNKRRRPISDITVWYWRSSSIFLTLGSFLWIFDEYFKDAYIVMVAILVGGFIMSIMIGMLYKVVPFLVWFHLNGMGYMKIPTINEMINKKLAKTQFILFILSSIGFIFSFYYPSMLQISAISFIVSMVILQYNIITPVRVYIKTKKGKPDFDMNTFSIS